MIPMHMPPPPDAVGWTPNSLGPSASQIQNLAIPLTTGGGQLALGMTLVYFRLTHAMILAGADVAIGAVPIAGRMYLPVGAMLMHSNTVAGAYNTTRTLSLAYANNPTVAVTPIQNIVVAATASDEQRLTAIAGGPLNPGVGVPFAGQALVAHFSGGNTGGNAANFVDLIVPVLTFDQSNL